MAENKKTSVFGSGLIWFGAAVSIAEILTGALFAPLGLIKGTAAIIIGHAIGCTLLYCAGLLGARHSMSAMETAKLTFGTRGGKLFASLNILQLVGWTAVMIASGAASAQVGYTFPWGSWTWAVIIGILILTWISAGIGLLQKINLVTMILLFGLSAVLSKLVFSGDTAQITAGSGLTFGAALELSIAMPVSWLPLIADYTGHSERPKACCFVSAFVYFAVSCWMYIIGMAAAAYAGETEIAAIMSGAGLGLSAILIVVLSTVTTTFLDVHSAAVSCESIFSGIPRKIVASTVCVVGVLLAIFCNTGAFEGFLYLIGSVFVPMITIQITDTLILGRVNSSPYMMRNLILWAIGFIFYRIFLYMNLPYGSTLPVMAACAILCIAVPPGRSKQ